MRIRSWLLLAVAMGGGTAFAFLVGLVWFPLKPMVVSQEVPQSQVLVAKKDIPVGTVLYADSVQYDFVPNDRIPIGATTDFFRIYARRTLNPISQGSPICDLDMEGTFAGSTKNDKTVPAGMTLVRVQIDRIQGTPLDNILPRLTEGTFSVDFLADSLKPNDLVDLMVLELAEGNKNIYIRKPPKLVASGIQVHSAIEIPANKNCSGVSGTASQEYPSLVLRMSQEQISLAKTAAKEGRLQVFPHRVEERVAPVTSPVLVEPAVKIADSAELQEIEVDVSPTISFSYSPGKIIPVAGTLPIEEKRTAPEPIVLEPPATEPSAPEPPMLEKPRPKVIDVGLGAYKRPMANKGRSSNPSSTVEVSTRKNGGETPPVEIYSFTPKNRKKTDLFPKHFYGVTELNQELSIPIAAWPTV
ncbi:MAG: hypothetical protein FWC43_08900 [Planctomycetaceae bacterium]|nr:hypothetical protein [Planctomycetaceae bacterium]